MTVSARRWLTLPARLTFAYDGATIVGAAVIHSEESEAEIVYLAVRERMRGRGFGKKIVEALIKEARSHQTRTIIVGTAKSSINDIAFYQKCGFRMNHVRHDFFDYFPEPIPEVGILCRDMIVFRLVLA